VPSPECRFRRRLRKPDASARGSCPETGAATSHTRLKCPLPNESSTRAGGNRSPSIRQSRARREVGAPADVTANATHLVSLNSGAHAFVPCFVSVPGKRAARPGLRGTQGRPIESRLVVGRRRGLCSFDSPERAARRSGSVRRGQMAASDRVRAQRLAERRAAAQRSQGSSRARADAAVKSRPGSLSRRRGRRAVVRGARRARLWVRGSMAGARPAPHRARA
jgi:hypothetical protein